MMKIVTSMAATHRRFNKSGQTIIDKLTSHGNLEKGVNEYVDELEHQFHPSPPQKKNTYIDLFVLILCVL